MDVIKELLLVFKRRPLFPFINVIMLSIDKKVTPLFYGETLLVLKRRQIVCSQLEFVFLRFVFLAFNCCKLPSDETTI